MNSFDALVADFAEKTGVPSGEAGPNPKGKAGAAPTCRAAASKMRRREQEGGLDLDTRRLVAP